MPESNQAPHDSEFDPELGPDAEAPEGAAAPEPLPEALAAAPNDAPDEFEYEEEEARFDDGDTSRTPVALRPTPAGPYHKVRGGEE